MKILESIDEDEKTEHKRDNNAVPSNPLSNISTNTNFNAYL
jgi:hypothetical protein